MDHFHASSDIGSTFTDTAVLDSGGHLTRYKAATVPGNPVEGVLATFETAARDRGLSLRDLLDRMRIFSHGPTIATSCCSTSAIPTPRSSAWATPPGPARWAAWAR
jgi:N-methylhydantoinase A